MSRTKKFKMTDLGPIPEDWEVRTLGEIGDPLMCKRILKSQTKECGDVPFYKIGTFGDKPDAYIDRSVFEYFRDHYSYPRKGDILLSAAGTIGRVVVFDGKDSYFQDSNIVWIRNDESKVLNEYLKLCYQTTDWQTEDGGSVSRLYNDNLKSTKIKFPVDAAEQRRIAAALSDADELIAALTELLEKKRNLKQGAMQQLLTGKRRLPGFKGKWGEKPLGDLLDYEQPQPYIVSNAEYDEDGIPVLTAGKSFVLGYTHDKTGVYSNLPVILFDDFLTISRFIAFPFKVKSSAVKMLHLKDERNSLAFIQMAMERLGYVPGDHQRHWISIFSKFQIPLPEPDEQHAITLMLTDMDEEIAGIEAELEKAKNVKTGMMQQLLTGKVRLEEA